MGNMGYRLEWLQLKYSVIGADLESGKGIGEGKEISEGGERG